MLASERKWYADTVMHGIVQQAGFATVGEFREAVRAQVRQRFGDAKLSDGLRGTIEEAFQMQQIGQVVGADWRMLAKPWAAVFDQQMVEVCEKIRGFVDDLWSAGLPNAVPSDARVWLGPSLEHVVHVHRKAKSELATMRRRLDEKSDTIGQRVLALALCMAFDARCSARYQPALRMRPRLFHELDDLVESRNSVDHFRAGAPYVDVEVFQAKVIAVMQAFAAVGA